MRLVACAGSPHQAVSKFLGGYFMPYISINFATGEVVAALNGTSLGTRAGGSGFADTYVQPLNMGWHFGKRVDFNAGYSFTAPTGRYTAGASNNVGSGYWGNNITSGTTLYITKNQGTTANLYTNWEIHGQKTVASAPAGQLSKITPARPSPMSGELAGSSLEEGFQPIGPTRIGWVRPMAGYR